MSELTMESLRNHPAEVIRAQISVRCNALGLTREQRNECENVGLEPYWRWARSIAWCTAAGVRKAHELAKVQA